MITERDPIALILEGGRSAFVAQGDCRKRLKELPDNSIDAVVTDPPAGIEFMGKEWDALKSGDYWQTGAGFSKPGIGERTTAWPAMTGSGANATCATCGGRMRGSNRCACDVPDWRVKGQPIKDTDGLHRNTQLTAFQDFITEVFTEVYRVLKPGGHAIIWAIPRTSHHTAMGVERAGFEIRDVVHHLFGTGFPKSLNVSKALAKSGRDADWQGWGTALKPAAENWILARKLLTGTVATNVLKHGTGALNIDATRAAAGRWPTNVALSHSEGCSVVDSKEARDCVAECAVRMLDEQNEQSGASRFFYTAKAPASEKNAILECACTPKLKVKDIHVVSVKEAKVQVGQVCEVCGEKKQIYAHPTVKSVSLMEWLVKLVTPPGGVVLDPFSGSGSTGVAARKLGFRFIGMEQDKLYCALARHRVKNASPKDET